MGLAVVTVASGGLAVAETTRGVPVTEAANGRGIAVTKVVGKPYGLPVTFEAIGLINAVTWDPATAASVVLTVNNCIATNTGTTSANQGARVATASGKTIGKYYFELQLTQVLTNGGFNVGAGIGTTASTFTTMGGSATTGVVLYNSSNIWSNNVNTGLTLNGGAVFPQGATYICVAVDLTARKMWFRKTISGIWNGVAGHNPETGTGGVTVPAGTMVPFCTFGGTNGTPNVSWGAAFGGTTFDGIVPAGFTRGWPA